MIVNPHAQTILCYGDSNTWGQKPDKSGRFAADVRWTGALQAVLGDRYYVIEEGLSSRTTDLEYTRKPGRNGKTYLEPCLDSHGPLDYVVLMLGTNDLKIEFNRSTQEIAGAVSGLVGIIRQKTAAEIIIASPILVNDKAPNFLKFYSNSYNLDSAIKSQQFAKEMQKIAELHRCVFVDAAKVAHAGEDGIHFTQDSHYSFAQQLALLFQR